MKQIDPNELILKKLDELSTEVKALRTDTRGVKTDVSKSYLRLGRLEDSNKAIQTDIYDLKTDVSSLKKDVKLLKKDVRHQGILHEQTDSAIERIGEIVKPYADEVPQLRQHLSETDSEVQFQGRRISVLEKSLL